MSITIEHEAPLEVLQRYPNLLPSLLRDQLGQPLPENARLRAVAANFNLTVAQESRSDTAAVIEVVADQPLCAVIAESQRARDPDKWFAWPYYLAALHKQYHCPAYLLVFAIGEEAAQVAAWAKQPIRTFQPGSGFAPLVIGPGEIPAVASVEVAAADVARAVLSGILHVGDPGGEQVAYRVPRAVHETQGFDALYWLLNLFGGIVGEKRYTEIQRLVMLDMRTSFIPRSRYDWKQHNKGKKEGKKEGRKEGKAEGKAEAVLEVLAVRGLTVSEEQRARLLMCTDGAMLTKLIALAMSADSAAELVARL